MTGQNKPQYIIVHHSSGSVHDTVASIRSFHIEKRGWQDIGYNRIILNPQGCHTLFQEPKDLIQQGRKDDVIGAHCLKYNAKSIGICLVGNFEIEEPPEPMILALKECLKLLSNQYLIPIENVLGHKEVGQTLCPGKYLFQRLWELKKELGV
jgi:hypothetical protein